MKCLIQNNIKEALKDITINPQSSIFLKITFFFLILWAELIHKKEKKMPRFLQYEWG
jgi:hypothetical protein